MKKKRIQGQGDGLRWPEWRLYANFLHREIARLWYGKKSVFTPVFVKGDAENTEFWELFNFIIVMAVQKFGLSHGLTHDEMATRAKNFVEDYEKLRSRGIAFASPLLETVSFICGTLDDKLASEFLLDPYIIQTCILAGVACSRAVEGKMPPYENGAKLRPIEFYEDLPVAPELEEQFYGENPSLKS